MARLIYRIGIDEVGRGPLAGPVCVGACAAVAGTPRGVPHLLRGVRDSKKLTEKGRILWYKRIRRAAARGEVMAATSFVGEKIIDEKGIAFALRVAIRRVLRRLALPPENCLVLLDGGLKAPRSFEFQRTVVGGDETEPLIAGASIVAKVRRDKKMEKLARRFPEYGFELHKGYGTGKHYEALREYGPCELHRRSFLKRFLVPI